VSTVLVKRMCICIPVLLSIFRYGDSSKLREKLKYDISLYSKFHIGIEVLGDLQGFVGYIGQGVEASGGL